MLHVFFEELNQLHFSGQLPLCSLKWNSRLQTSAGRFIPGRRNIFETTSAMIEVATYLQKLPDGEKHIRDTLLHEMIHYDLWHRRRPYGHNKEFYSIMKRTGAIRFNSVPNRRPIKYWYECPACLVHIPARKNLGIAACAVCCKKYTGGDFSKKFLLRLLSPTEAKLLALPAEQKIVTIAKESTEEILLPMDKVLETLESIRDTIKKAKIFSPFSRNL